MICGKCGTENPVNATSCVACGAGLVNSYSNSVYNNGGQQNYNAYNQAQYQQPYGQPMYGQQMYVAPVYTQPVVPMKVQPTRSIYMPNIFGIISVLIFISSLFLPLFTERYYTWSYSYREDEFTFMTGPALGIGLLGLLVGLLCLAFAIADLNTPLLVFSIILNVCTNIFAVAIIVEAADHEKIDVGIGTYFLVIGALLMLAASIFGKVFRARRYNRAVKEAMEDMMQRGY